MRTNTTQNMTVTYPNYLVFEGDNNYVQLEATNGTATLIVEVNGNRQMYSSETDFVLIDISALIRKVGVYNSAVTLYINYARTNPDASQILNTTMYVVRGRSMADRYHCSGRKIILPAGTTRADILVDDTSILAGGTSTITSNGPEIVSYGVTDGCVVNVKNSTSTKAWRGWFNSGEYTYEQNYEITILSCIPENGAVLKWYDIDGCARYVAGKVMSRSSKAETMRYFEGNSVVKSIASGLVTNIERSFDFGIAQADPALHLEEIVFSHECLILDNGGNTLKVIPAFDEYLGSTKEIEDITLSFIAQI